MRTGVGQLHVDAMLLWMSDLDCRSTHSSLNPACAALGLVLGDTSIGAAADHRPLLQAAWQVVSHTAQLFPASQAALQGSSGSVVAGLGGCGAFEPVSPLFLSMGHPSMGKCYYYPMGLGAS